MEDICMLLMMCMECELKASSTRQQGRMHTWLS